MHHSAPQNHKTDAISGLYGDIIASRQFRIEEGNRPIIGHESHTLYLETGSPFTFMTSEHQPLNEGKVFVLKIDPDIFFEDVKPSKEYAKRIDRKHEAIIS